MSDLVGVVDKDVGEAAEVAVNEDKPSGKKFYQYERKGRERKLTPIAEEAVRLYLANQPQTKIAKRLKVGVITVNKWINSKAGQKRIADFNQLRTDFLNGTRERIQDLTNLSMSILSQILNGRDQDGNELFVSIQDKGKLALEFMKEFSGLRAPTQIQTHSVVMTADRLEEIKRRGARLLAEMNMPSQIIDVDVEHEESTPVSIN